MWLKEEALLKARKHLSDVFPYVVSPCRTAEQQQVILEKGEIITNNTWALRKVNNFGEGKPLEAPLTFFQSILNLKLHMWSNGK